MQDVRTTDPDRRFAVRFLRAVAEWWLVGLAVDGAAIVGIPASELGVQAGERAVQREAARGITDIENFLRSAATRTRE
jgi:hypothetical protein